LIDSVGIISLPLRPKIADSLVLLHSTSEKENADVAAGNVGTLSSPGGLYLIATSLLLARRSSVH
jgi:hypothetical protein